MGNDEGVLGGQMAELIRYSDGVLVEIAESPDRTVAVSGRGVAEVDQGFQSAGASLRRILGPIVRSVRGALEAEQIDECTLELGFNFTAEGGVFVKIGGAASITASIKLSRKGTESGAP